MGIQGRTGAWRFVIVLLLAGSCLLQGPGIVTAQEMSDEVMQQVMVQYTLEYRFSPDLKVGDWVKYKLESEGDPVQELELRVTKKEKGGVWIVEESPGMEIQLLVDLKQMKLIRGFGIDKEGERHDVSPLSDEEIAQVVGSLLKGIEQEMESSPIVTWREAERATTIETPAGDFNCTILEPEYSEQHAQQMADYTKVLKKQGKSDEEIDAVLGNPSFLFNENVPRLLPINIAAMMIPFIVTFGEVDGGLVACRQVMHLELIAYGAAGD